MGMTVTYAEGRDLITIPKVMAKAQGIHDKASAAIETSSAFLEAVDTLTGKVSNSVKDAFGTMGFVGAFNAVFAIPSLINNIAKAVRTSSVVERVKSVFKAVLDVGSLWMGANGILNGLKSVGVIAESALSWTAIVNAVLFPLQIISLGLDAHNLAESTKERNELLAKIRPTGLAKYTVSDLTEGCRYIVQNHERLRKTLHLSKGTTLDVRAQKLFERLERSDGGAKEDAIAFMKILRTRINTKYNLEVAGLAAKTAGVVIAGVSFFVPPNPVTWGLAGVCGVASLLIFGLEKVLLNKDPFSAPRDVWHAKLAHKVREGFGGVTNLVERISLKTLRCVQ